MKKDNGKNDKLVAVAYACVEDVRTIQSRISSLATVFSLATDGEEGSIEKAVMHDLADLFMTEASLLDDSLSAVDNAVFDLAGAVMPGGGENA